jgi:hypothetical protein
MLQRQGDISRRHTVVLAMSVALSCSRVLRCATSGRRAVQRHCAVRAMSSAATDQDHASYRACVGLCLINRRDEVRREGRLRAMARWFAAGM